MANTDRQKKAPSGATAAKLAGTPLRSPAGKLLATTFALPPAALAGPYPIADRHRPSTS